MRSILPLALASAFVLPCPGADSAEVGKNWAQFRGPAAGRIEGLAHPLEWSAKKNLAWSVELPGSGWSSPVVAGGRVFVTSAAWPGQAKPTDFADGVKKMRSFRGEFPPKSEIDFALTCLDLATGKKHWTKRVAKKRAPFSIHPSNTYATESPATDGERVISWFGAIGTVAAHDLEGEELWKVELGAHPTGNGFGSGSSLALSKDRVFVQFDNDEKSFLVALATATGKELWRADREELRSSWASPFVWKNSKREELVLLGAQAVHAYAPATGELLWKLVNFESSFSSSPAADRDRLYFGTSGPRSSAPLAAVRAGAEGTIDVEGDEAAAKAAGLVWERKQSGPGLGSPVALDGLLYVTRQSFLTCYDAASGERVYKERLPAARSAAASLWAGEGRIFILDEKGKTFVVKAGREFELLGTNELDDLCWSTPSVAGSALLIRGASRLHCIRASERKKTAEL